MSLTIEHRSPEQLREHNDDTVMFTVVSGVSESGKSALSAHAKSTGLASRIKYLRVAAEASGGDDPFGYLDICDQSNPAEALRRAKAIWSRIEELTRDGPGISYIETMKHPWLMRSLGELAATGEVNAHHLLVYVDAPLEKRVAREVARTGRSTEDIQESVAAKDAIKAGLGLAGLKSMADITIMNDGTLEEFTDLADGLVRGQAVLYSPAGSGQAVYYD
jgi:hypothetical protein